MKNLENLSVTRLSVLEFGQHVKSIQNGISALGGGTLVADDVLKKYLTDTVASSAEYDKALLQIAKSDETAKIADADVARDLAMIAAKRFLSVYELTEIETQQVAYQSLSTVFKLYKGLQNWNFEEESNAIDNLITELKTDKYAAHVATLGMDQFVNKLEAKNSAFKTLFAGRSRETANKAVYDVIALRKDMKTRYTDMADYVLSMSKATDAEQFNQSLSLINTVRKYYADLLAKRKPVTKEEVVVPIEPMAIAL